MKERNIGLLRSELINERIPLEICFEITTRCNFQCVHCFNRENRYTEISHDKLDRLEAFIRDSKTMTVLLTGGEFFLHPYAMDVLERMKQIGNIGITVYSNASLINDEIAKYLKENNIKVEVTLYGASSDTYKAVTGSADNYYKVCHGLSSLDAHGVDYKLKGIYLKQNFAEAEEIQKIISKHNGEETFVNFELFGNKKRIQDSRLTDQQSIQLYKRYDVQCFTNRTPFGQCGAGKLQCCIRPDGTVIPCVGWNETVIGNIFTDSFSQISSAFDMKHLRNMNIKCGQCDHSDFCDVCPMFFYQDTGSSMVVSSEVCRHAKLRHMVYDAGETK